MNGGCSRLRCRPNLVQTLEGTPAFIPTVAPSRTSTLVAFGARHDACFKLRISADGGRLRCRPPAAKNSSTSMRKTGLGARCRRDRCHHLGAQDAWWRQEGRPKTENAMRSKPAGQSGGKRRDMCKGSASSRCVSINRFRRDTDAEIALDQGKGQRHSASKTLMADHWAEGGKGAAIGREQSSQMIADGDKRHKFIYPNERPLIE